MRASIESALATHAPIDAPPTWVLSNHDVTRPVTRYGRADTSFAFESKREGTPTDLVLRDKARAGGRAAGDGAPGLDVHLPGRRAWTARSGEHPVAPPTGSDVAAIGRRRPGPRRMPCAAPVVWRDAALRLQQRRSRPSLARSARRLGAAHGRGSERRPGLHAQPVPRRPPTASRGAVGRRENGALDSRRTTRSSPSHAERGSCASSTSARTRLNFRSAPTS